MRDVAKQLRGGDFRRAVGAVAALRHIDGASAARLVPSIEPDDPQRAFQVRIARIVVEGGIHGLASRWRELPSPEWREMLLREIGQSFPLWADEGTIELFLAGLEDPEDHVARQVVSLLVACLRERPARERKDVARTARGRAALDAWDRAAAWMTPARRARIARAVTLTLQRHADNPKALTWPEDYIQLLGLTAIRTDATAIALLEGFRRMAGEPRRSEFERLDPYNLPWPTSVLAKKRGIAPGTPFVRVWSRPTGLLDLERLDDAIARIRARE